MNEHKIKDEIFGEVIDSYTRKDALEDGLLFDVTETANEAGYKVPVAISAGVEALLQRADANKKSCSDYEGVLWDILWMSTRVYREVNESTRYFEVLINGAGRKRKWQFKAIAHAGDSGECVVTIMLPNED